MAALDFPASPSDGDTYTPSNSAITYTFSSSKGSWQGSLSGTSSAVPSTITLAATNTTSATHFPLFSSSATGDEEPRTDTGLTYNPGTNVFTAVNFAGDLTGDVTGNASGTAATVTNATQAAITTLSNLVTTGALDSGSITSGFGTINTGSSTITSTGAISGGSFVVPNDGDIGSTGATDAIQISSGGIVTFKDDIVLKDDGTIGTATTPALITLQDNNVRLTTTSTTDTDAVLQLYTTDTGSGSSPDMYFWRNSSSPAASDFLGKIIFYGENDASEAIPYASLTAQITDPADSTENGRFIFTSKAAGSDSSYSMGGDTTGHVFTIPDGSHIGSTTDRDAISIGSDGDVTLTQDLELQHDGAILSFGANDEIALTHVHDTGLALTDSGGTPTLQFHDSNESVSSDGTNLILTSGGTSFKIPTADGSNGHVLQTNGSGTLSFAAASGGSSLTVQDEGGNLSTAATTLNFVGAGVAATGSGATKTITVTAGPPGGSSSQLQYNNSSNFGGMSQFTYSAPAINVAAGELNMTATSTLLVTASVFKIEGTSATNDPSNTLGMHWYDGTYRMHVRPKAWADNNDTDNAIVLPTWGVDLNMFSQRNKKDLRDHSITHDTSNGKYIYILTDEYARTNHDTGSDRYSILIGHDVERGTNASGSSYNISMGYQASYNMSGGNENIHIGYQAAYGNGASGGSRNIYLGYKAGFTDTDNSYNIGMGIEALYGTRNSSSNYNIGIGYRSYYQEEDSASQQYNIAIGHQAGYGYGFDNNSYRSYNSDENIAIGRDSMYQGFPGDRNIAIGSNAMYLKNDNQSQLNPLRNTENIAIGYQAMYYIKSHTNYGSRTPSEFGRQYNVALGYRAGYGYDSTSEGLDAFGVYIGYEAGYNIRGLGDTDSDTSDQYRNTRGSKNVFIGYRAGKDVTFGKGNVIIGGHTGTAGTSFNNEVHIYAGDTERMKIDSSGLSVNGAAVGGGAPSHTSFGFDNFRGQDNCQAKLSHWKDENKQEDYPSTSSKLLDWGWFNAGASSYIGNKLFIVPAVGDTASVVVYDNNNSSYGKQSFTWTDVSNNYSNGHNGLYVDNDGNSSYHVYLSYNSGNSSSNGQRWVARRSTNNPTWDSSNGIWRSNDSGSDYNGTWIGTYSGEDNATRDGSHYSAWQPQGPIANNAGADYSSKPACTSYCSTYHFRERIIERDSQHGHLGSYWLDSNMPPGAQGNSTTASDWITWESTSTSWTHVYDHYQNASGDYWTGDLHFHPRFDTRIEFECELHWMADADDSQIAWALGAIIDSREYYSNSWGTGTSGFQWLTDYADKDKYHGSRHSSSHSNALNYTKLSRTLHVNGAANQSNYQWNCREATMRHPWTIGLFNKISAGTVYLKQFRLKAKYYA